MAMYRHFPPADTGKKTQNKEIKMPRIKPFIRTGRSGCNRAIISWIPGSKQGGINVPFGLICEEKREMKSQRKSKCAGRRLVGAQYKNYVDSTGGGKSRFATWAGRLEVELPVPGGGFRWWRWMDWVDGDGMQN